MAITLGVAACGTTSSSTSVQRASQPCANSPAALKIVGVFRVPYCFFVPVEIGASSAPDLVTS
jgi:hypothetical protein